MYDKTSLNGCSSYRSVCGGIIPLRGLVLCEIPVVLARILLNVLNTISNPSIVIYIYIFKFSQKYDYKLDVSCLGLWRA